MGESLIQSRVFTQSIRLNTQISQITVLSLSIFCAKKGLNGYLQRLLNRSRIWRD